MELDYRIEMNTLSFLSPSLAADRKGFHPVARSSMERRQREAGATFEERHGWLVPVSIPGESEYLQHVGIADLSHLGKIEVRTNATSPSLDDADGVVWYRISPRRALVVCPTGETPGLLERLAGDFEHALDVSASLSILALAGPEAWTVVRRLTHLHHAPSSGEAAHVNTVHLLDVDGCLWLVFPQEYGDYLWEVAVDRAESLGGGPIGIDALPGAGR
jgi:glycine cleavage system aminomethyltransferase T